MRNRLCAALPLCLGAICVLSSTTGARAAPDLTGLRDDNYRTRIQTHLGSMTKESPQVQMFEFVTPEPSPQATATDGGIVLNASSYSMSQNDTATQAAEPGLTATLAAAGTCVLYIFVKRRRKFTGTTDTDAFTAHTAH